MCLKNIRYFILDYNWDVFLIIAINFREILRNHRIPIAFFITILNSLILLRLLKLFNYLVLIPIKPKRYRKSFNLK